MEVLSDGRDRRDALSVRAAPLPAPIVGCGHGPAIIGRRQSAAQSEHGAIDGIVSSFPKSARDARWLFTHCRDAVASNTSRRFKTSRQTPAASRSPFASRSSICIEACRNADAPCSRSIARAHAQILASRDKPDFITAARVRCLGRERRGPACSAAFPRSSQLRKTRRAEARQAIQPRQRSRSAPECPCRRSTGSACR